jgi:hypothetical protein
MLVPARMIISYFYQLIRGKRLNKLLEIRKYETLRRDHAEAR